ncbi:RluA family pseudouridine synthase [Ornithinibacillus massiliensis]|uniref:Pseudouridine synthase n=1 Tax=Ornithinibacillus massiliensis TaxID=1944633 RepID=A0ABS5MGN3_9BACI|nr:RluA family pseudouridine synthase [Ornithinibacillus massiliensis]MBS3681032.1 RluA family pseudouridine synthase [Ornithinibacillus massiliensis]
MSQNRRNAKPTRSGTLKFKVNEPSELLAFLLQKMEGRSRNSVKSILTRGQVKVDDHIETKHNYPLQPGQVVSVLKNKVAVKESTLIGMKILFEDNSIIVIEKDAGLLSIATETEKKNTALHQLMDYVKRRDPRNRVFVVHRLDKETSGVMMFAKSEKVKRKLQDNWKELVQERTYVALVEGELKKPEGTVKSWLKESKTHKMYSVQDKDGQFAITHFRKIQSNKQFSLVEVNLETGRKNQIRVHLSDIGYPIVGDKKYGAKTNEIGRLGLHAKILSFHHPVTGQLMLFKSDMPKSFLTKSR